MIPGFRRFLQYLLLPVLLLAQAAGAQTNHLVIAEIYGGGSNASAAYANDYVMLYNPTTAAISLSGYSLQYASSSGTSWTTVTLPTADSVQAGHYYLVGLYSNSQQGGTNVGAALPTPDFQATSATYLSSGSVRSQSYAINMSAQYGKVLLSNSATITPAGTSCPVGLATTVDFVGFGAANCYEGTGPAANAAYTNSTAVSRTVPGTDTDDNSADFHQISATPRNSSYSTSAMSVGSASANPSSVNSGSTTTLTVVVNPGSFTSSATVTADLSTLGGSATQALALGSTAYTYSYTYAVPTGTAATSYAIPVKATDNTTATATGSIALTVTAPVTTTPIATLQGNRGTYVGTSVSTTGVVTSVVYNGFFMQMPGTPASRTSGISEGIDVFTSSAPTVHVGDNVTVSGSLTLYPLATASVTPALEISRPTVTINSSGNVLPAPIVLTTADLTPGGGFQQITRYESMRVQMSLTATSGTGAPSLSGSTEVNETYTSNGYFYAVMTGTPRPFREPGVDVRDTGASALPTTVQRFDDNPERIYVATTLMNAAPVDVSTGATFSNVTGILDFTYSNDSYYDPSRFIPDAGSLLANYTAGITPVAAALPSAGQATVAAFNIERFYNTSSADDKDYYPVTGAVTTSQAVDITPAAYARRLTKVSLAIRHMLNNPDIIAVEEAENGFVLKDIAAQISADAITAGESDPQYVAYGTDNSTFYSNDLSGISVGFLVKSTVDVTGFDQFFASSTFTPTGGNLTTVNDRPPFVLHAGIKRGTGVKDYPITVIVNHLKALPDTTTAVQQKKELQVEQLASLFQGYQANGEHVLAVGDFNAFEFNDGYGDYLGTATNNVVAAPTTTVTPGKTGLVTPAPTDLALTLPASLRYSYVEDGNAQILDHIIASADIAGSTQLAYVHFNADFPETAYNDATTPARVSDHDPALAYLAVPAPTTKATLGGNGTFATAITIGQSSSGQQLTLTNTGETTVSITGFTVTGDFAQSNTCGSSLAVGSSCVVNVVFTPTAAGTRTGSITLVGSATVTPVALSGTGLSPADFSVGDSSNSTTTSLTVSAGTSGTVSLKFTSVSGFAGSITLTCAASGTAATGVTCAVPSPVTLAAAGTTTATVTLTTTARTTASTSGLGSMPTNGRMAWLILAGLMTGGMLMVRRNGRAVRVGGLLMMLFTLTLGVTGCGSSSKLNLSPNANGTPNGTYTYVVTATSGSAVHTETIKLTVN